MSKSKDFVLRLLETAETELNWKQDDFFERPSEKYFDEHIEGNRQCIIQTPIGSIKVILKFDENVEFNCVQSFGGLHSDLEHLLYAAAYEVLYDKKFKVPAGEENRIQDGDTLILTFGNFIIGEKMYFECEKLKCSIKIMLPTKYKRIKGGAND